VARKSGNPVASADERMPLALLERAALLREIAANWLLFIDGVL
jgi:hypothetical protein